MRKLRWVLTNVVFAIFIYMATVLEIAGAHNLLWVVTGFGMLTALAIILSDDFRDTMIKKGFVFNSTADIVYDCLVIGVFAWFGFWGLTICYSFVMLIIIGAIVAGQE